MGNFTSHKGSWGERYVIEQPKNKERITCSDCVFYHEDGSCTKRPIVISEVGYNYWRYCKDFVLSIESETDKRCDYIARIKGYKALESYHESEVHKKKIDSNQSKYTYTDGTSPIVQLGDIVKIERVENKKIRTYKVEMSPFSKELPVILEKCINRKENDCFLIDDVKYRIVNIKKGKQIK